MPHTALRPLAFEGFSDLTVLHVCRHMRRVDAEEVFAMRPDADAFALYRDIAALGGRHLWFEVVRPATAMQPIALFGVVGTSPGCGLAHMIATDDLTAGDARQIVARIHSAVAPVMLDHGLHRIEALALSSHRWAHRFLRACGALPEGPPRRATGKCGEDFQAFVWLRDDFTRRFSPSTAPDPVPFK
ncbi:MAG: hypothetical protein V4712_15220 [Pseudomonadota bacterium]